MTTSHSITAATADLTTNSPRRTAGPIRPLSASNYDGAPFIPVARAATDSQIGEDTIRKRLASKLRRVGKTDYICITIFNLEFFGEEDLTSQSLA